MTYGTQAFAFGFEFQDIIADWIFPTSGRRSLADSGDMYLDNFEDYGMPSFMFLYVLTS